MKGQTATATKARSLLEFASEKRKAERRQTCPVCRLPEEVRAELRIARERKIERRLVREWLQTELGVALTDLDFTTHHAGHHEDREGVL